MSDASLKRRLQNVEIGSWNLLCSIDAIWVKMCENPFNKFAWTVPTFLH